MEGRQRSTGHGARDGRRFDRGAHDVRAGGPGLAHGRGARQAPPPRHRPRGHRGAQGLVARARLPDGDSETQHRARGHQAPAARPVRHARHGGHRVRCLGLSRRRDARAHAAHRFAGQEERPPHRLGLSLGNAVGRADRRHHHASHHRPPHRPPLPPRRRPLRRLPSRRRPIPRRAACATRCPPTSGIVSRK